MAVEKTIRILVVDDYLVMRRMIIQVLRRCGFENISEAENGLTALAKVKDEKFDLVIADWNMPKMTGLELLKEIRSDDNLKKLPVLMVTAEALVENIVAAVRAGVNDYIVKPFNEATLNEKINKIFQPRKK